MTSKEENELLRNVSKGHRCDAWSKNFVKSCNPSDIMKTIVNQCCEPLDGDICSTLSKRNSSQIMKLDCHVSLSSQAELWAHKANTISDRDSLDPGKVVASDDVLIAAIGRREPATFGRLNMPDHSIGLRKVGSRKILQYHWRHWSNQGSANGRWALC